MPKSRHWMVSMKTGSSIEIRGHRQTQRVRCVTFSRGKGQLIFHVEREANDFPFYASTSRNPCPLSFHIETLWPLDPLSLTLSCHGPSLSSCLAHLMVIYLVLLRLYCVYPMPFWGLLLLSDGTVVSRYTSWRGDIQRKIERKRGI